MEAPDSKRHWSADVVDLLVRSGELCLNVNDPSWDDARGYLLDEAEMILFFPVAKKYLAGADTSDFQVLIWGQPRALARGALHPANSEQDTATQLRLAEAGGMERQSAVHAAGSEIPESQEDSLQAHPVQRDSPR
jgi:hypothetical protein